MAEFRKLPTQAELQNMLFMEQMRVKNPQQIAQEALASGTTVSPIPENVFQKIAGGAGIAKEYVNRAGSAADLAKLFPGYKPETRVNIPTGYNFAPKQAPSGEIIPGGLQTQNVNLGQVLQAIKPADVLGISGAERAYSDIGAGKAPQPLDVLDVAGLGATGLVGGKAALRATKGVPVGMSIQEAKGLLTEAPRSPLGFYSALEESALNLQRNKGSGQAFLNDLQKAPNVKADEIKWTGLDEFLKTKPNVTKQEVQDYLANNRVEVQEVQLGTNPTRWEGNALYVNGNLAGEIKDTSSGYAWKTPDGQYNLLNANRMFDAVNKVENNLGVSVPETIAPKFGSYTLPGGENYREILLTMPSNMSEYNKYTKALREKYGEGGFANLPLTDIERARLDKFYAAEDIDPYKSTHFPQENILAHLRVNDRVDADGKKMLLIEEVQSDWHQAGREKGYRALPEGAKIIEQDGWYEVQRKDGRLLGNGGNTAEEAKASAIDFLSGDRVPDAPFKDSWYQLALKRAIQYAAENGYDRIGLTTGSQQAARFDLSKQIGALSIQPKPNGMVRIDASKDGEVVMMKDVPKDQLSDYIGKEMAKKAISDIDAGKNAQYSDLDLQVGGEGMKKYYDEIYPKFLDKYGKKWGARVGETKVDAEGMQEPIRYLDVTPEMKASVSKGQPLFQALPAIPATGLLATQDENR